MILKFMTYDENGNKPKRRRFLLYEPSNEFSINVEHEESTVKELIEKSHQVIACQENSSKKALFHMVTFVVEGCRQIIYTDAPVYILNNAGQTIEKL
jgi:hypothetical protein